MGFPLVVFDLLTRHCGRAADYSTCSGMIGACGLEIAMPPTKHAVHHHGHGVDRSAAKEVSER
jgi:hypothetical protein